MTIDQNIIQVPFSHNNHSIPLVYAMASKNKLRPP